MIIVNTCCVIDHVAETTYDDKLKSLTMKPLMVITKATHDKISKTFCNLEIEVIHNDVSKAT